MNSAHLHHSRYCIACRRALTLVAVVIGLSGCGATSKPNGSSSSSRTVGSTGVTFTSTGAATPSGGSSSPTATGARSAPSDNDGDGDNGEDDLGWGTAANQADTQAVTQLVMNFYAAALADDGATACSEMYSLFAEEVAEVYGEGGASPAYMHGGTCAAVMSGLFKHERGKLRREIGSLRVTRVRIKHLRAIALLAVGQPRERQIVLHREHTTWKVNALLDEGLG